MCDEMDSILSKLGLGICSAAFRTEKISPDIVCKLSMHEMRYLGINNSADMMKLRVKCIKYGPLINDNHNEPTYNISKSILETLIESGFKICEISKLLSVSERTLYRRMSKYQLSVYEFTSIDDDTLQRHVLQVTKEFPRVGETFIRHILHQKGIKVSATKKGYCIMAEAIVRDKTRPTTACDLCRTLTADDIPGANLTKSPSKAKKTELQFWMKCRGLKFKSVDTRAVLIDRVQSCIENEYAIIDPDPSKCYTKAKRNICLCNQNRNPTEVRPTLNEEDEADILSQVPSSGWTKEILVNKKFSFINIESHAKNSGRNLKGGQYIEKPLKKGYKFFYENYVHSATTVLKEGICFLRAKCYRSQRKNEQPHSITIALQDEVVINAHCSCAAGAGGYCNHIIAVLYLVDHCIKMSIVEFPEIGTCTDNPQQWHRPRTEGITAEQIMEVHVIRPEYGSSMTGIKSSLYNASAKSIWDDEISGMTCTLFGDLAKINPSFGFCQVFDQTTTSFQQTKLGFHVPVGSVLSYQLSITEGDFEVLSDFSSVSTNNTPVSMTDFPILPIAPSHYQYKLSHKLSDEQAVFLKSLNYPFNKIVEIEEETQTQRECPLWFAERQFRLTASTFGNIINRKSVSDKFVKSLLTSKDISHVPAVKYGIENEQKALGKYCEYMKNIKKDIRVYHSGLVINPGFCWLAASPDGKFADKDAGYGLLEVKCPYTHRDITPKSACRDESFCSKFIDGKPKLKTSHNYFYQIQGQMGICGLEFCDFIIYTKKGMSIERVKFDREFWNLMLDKLTNFYFKHFITVVITEKSSV